MDKTLPTQQKARIAILILDWNLLPTEVGLAPIRSGPVGIQIVERSISRLQPLLKLRTRIGGNREQFNFANAKYRELAHGIAEQLAKRFGHNPLVIGWQIDNEYTEASFDVFRQLAFPIHTQRFWILLRQPSWRARGRSSQHDMHAMLTRRRHRPVKPVEVVVSFAGLHPAPGKFTHMNHSHFGLFHQVEISLPSGFGPLFRIPRRS
jgi:hypothetical protein